MAKKSVFFCFCLTYTKNILIFLQDFFADFFAKRKFWAQKTKKEALSGLAERLLTDRGCMEIKSQSHRKSTGDMRGILSR